MALVEQLGDDSMWCVQFALVFSIMHLTFINLLLFLSVPFSLFNLVSIN